MNTRLSFLLAIVLPALCAHAAETKVYDEALTPATLSEWQDARDGKVSACFAVDKTTFSTKEKLVVRCAIRNNTDKRITVLRPFGDRYYAWSAGITILGPHGPVSYHGAMKGYALGTSWFVELPAHTVAEDALELPVEYFPDLGAAGLYTMRYLFLAHEYPKQPSPANLWRGQVKTVSVTILMQ